jgi:hypothetical protein
MVLHLTTGAAPAAAAGPYQEIASRNIFGLQPPVVRTPNLPTVRLPKVMVVGITTLDKKCAVLKVRVPASSSAPATDWSCVLAEGQRLGPVEVLRIDEKDGSVKVNNSGSLVVLTLDQDGLVPKQAPPVPESPPTPLQDIAPPR